MDSVKNKPYQNGAQKSQRIKNKELWSSSSHAIADTISGAQNKKNTKQHFYSPLLWEFSHVSPIFLTIQASSLQSKTQNHENQRFKENQTRKREPAD